jgi:molybdate transport system ATP-binding protein
MAAALGKKGMTMRLCCRIPLASFDLDIDASFDARVTSIFGPSGSGKTTLLDAIAGLRQILAGEIEINGHTLFSSTRGLNRAPRDRGIGYVPQEGALFPHLSVRRNILFGANRDAYEKSWDVTVEHVLSVLEIGDLLDRPVTKLSGGESQRVALARAVLSRPQLLLLDEPLAALDIGLKERILPYLARVRDEFGIPMIYVTHNLTEVLALADWVLMIKQGRLLAQGAPKEALKSFNAIAQLGDEGFENVFNATFVESDIHAGRTKMRLPSGATLLIPYLAQPANGSLQIRVSADDILVATERPIGISAGNVLPGAIRRIDQLDGEAVLTVFAGDEFQVRLTAAAVMQLGLRIDMPVFLIIKTRSFRVV